MQFEPQCKTKAQVRREWARVLEMCEGTNVAPISCYKKLIEPNFNIFDIGFNSAPACYEFAIAIVEGKPVFRGDVLYRQGGAELIAESSDGHNLYGSGCCYAYGFLTWNAKPKTFTFADLPSPTESWHTERCANEFSIHFDFKTPEEATAMEKIVLGQLSKQM